ncbi:hypothetical protein ACIF9R_37700 [Streptomyces sp. NPDC086080]|uniref:hypothetical protein n=1 Tax=Streptomyces sp. NPDC086080 TaxID=3365748 RepID=UPI0037D7347E
MHGTVHSIAEDRNGQPYARLALNVPAGDTRFHVLLRSAHDSLIKPLAAGTHVLAFGEWTVFDTPHIPQLRLFADEHWQIAHWETDPSSGLPTDPTCPATVTARQRADTPAQARARARRPRPASESRPPQAPPTSPPPVAAVPPPQVQEPAEAPAKSVQPEPEPVDEPTVTPPHREPAAPPVASGTPPVPPRPPLPPPPLEPPQTGRSPRRRRWPRWLGGRR